MRISTWQGIWGNYIFKVEHANVFKVDSICKLLGLFVFLDIYAGLCYPAQQTTRQQDSAATSSHLPACSLQKRELLPVRHSVLRMQNC